jgi:hypothetical protein
MTQSFNDLVVGDVLVAPFVIQAACAALIVFLLRPVLSRLGFDRIFSAPPVAMLCLYILIVALLVVMA